jgi:alpha-glucoside transport system permease protein
VKNVLVVALAVVWLVPTIGLLVTSVRPQADIAASGWWQAAVRPHFTIVNYANVLTARNFFANFVNSFIITIPATVLPIIIGALAAYAFAWLRFRGRNIVFMIIVALLVLPLQETWVPVLKMQSRLGLTGRYLALWLAHTAYGLPFAIFLLRNFFGELPRELFEAAKLDGYSEYGVFRSIVLPLSVPALASLGIFQFVWVWNDLMNALVLLQDQHKFPLTVAIQRLLGSYGSEWNLLASGAFISMSIPLLVFFLLQRYFVQGITAGAVKG